MTSADLQKLKAYNALIKRFVASGRQIVDVPQQLQDLASTEKVLMQKSFSDLSVEEFELILSRIEVEQQLTVAREVMTERREVLRKLAE